MHILLVDDDVGVRETLGELLEYSGYKVTLASDGEDAWQRLTSDRKDDPAINVIVSDQIMPRSDGLELLRRVRADTRFDQIAFVLMSGNFFPGESPVAHAEKADASLGKPFDIGLLSEVLQRAYQQRVAPK